MAANLLGLAKTVAQLKRVPSLTVKDVAVKLNARLQAGFDAGTDPYGSGWAPLADATILKGRFPPPLTDIGTLRGTVVLTPLSGAGLALGDPPFYGPIHMAGTDFMPKRRYFPDAGMPSAWSQDIAESLHAKTVEVLAGG